jgi:hypothetical protein
MRLHSKLISGFASFFCVMTVLAPASIYSACKVWIPKGPKRSNIAALVVNHQNPATLYAGTNGGVFKSADSGAHWRRISDIMGQNVRTLVSIYIGFNY